jgi:hypothetical protein
MVPGPTVRVEIRLGSKVIARGWSPEIGDGREAATNVNHKALADPDTSDQALLALRDLLLRVAEQRASEAPDMDEDADVVLDNLLAARAVALARLRSDHQGRAEVLDLLEQARRALERGRREEQADAAGRYMSTPEERTP